LRRRLGEEGRRYALKFHSYDAVADMWEAIYRKIWRGEDVELTTWPPPQRETSPASKVGRRPGARAEVYQ
jgi:hypothetical protein